MVRACRWACPLIFDPFNVLPWVWQEVKGEVEGEVESLNVADNRCCSLLAARPRGRRRGGGAGVDFVEDDLPRPYRR